MNGKKSPLKVQMPSYGWKQFLIARDEMLSAYDRAKVHSSHRPVQTEHGNVAEGEFRKWLSEYLPKRYGVTSGYIISPGLPRTEPTVHYDVIIYDQLESPVLWVEGNPDSSDQGRSRAIPVEYVQGVIEVKSRFNKASAKKAVEQLSRLQPLLAQVEPANQPVKLHLPANFFCATVFFELRKEDEMDFAAMDELVEATMIRRFYGGYILRAEKLGGYYSGRIKFVKEPVNVEPHSKSLAFHAESKCIQAYKDTYFRLLLDHSETYFSEFAFNILAILKGNYHPDVISSPYCFGTTQFENGSASDVMYFKPEDVKRYQEETAAILKAQGFSGFEPSDILF